VVARYVPSIAVVISTRDRGPEAAAAARAVLLSSSDLELVVVDQSNDDETYGALSLIDDPRLRVIRSSLRGLSNARNVGVAATTAPNIAFTDDDCRPPPGWAASMLAALDAHPGAGLVFGAVIGPRTDKGDFVPEFMPSKTIVEGRMPTSVTEIGIGANFAVRREVLDRLGGFDPLLGAGAPRFRGAEELDLVMRALYRGERVVNVTEKPVFHAGIRHGTDVRRLIVSYRIATGAAFGKNARLTPSQGVRDCVRRAGADLAESGRALFQGRRPRPASMIYFLTGVCQSFRYGVDRKSLRFVDRDRCRAG
jgi:glycosyltransferase involved in cell wall biosynthesis